MDIAFCYESVLPTRGGCETYIAGLARRLTADGHAVHLYACRWDDAALPESIHYHPITVPSCPRFLRPWVFAAACRRALEKADHQVSIGFDKIWGMDIVYPQGGLHVASYHHNLLKYKSPFVRRMVQTFKCLDLAHRSFLALERKQYLGDEQPLVIAISEMVRGHFQEYYQFSTDDVRLVRLAPDPERLQECDRPRRRLEWRQQWNITPETTVALFVGLNYRLKGLEPLLHAVARMPANRPFKLLVAGSSATKDFERLARKLRVSDRVRFLGYCKEMRNCYFASDLLVHPTFYDPCSHVVLEAMTCGLPVITTRYNGASELLHPPREGYVIDDPHDHEHLAWCLTQLLDPARRAACGQAARKTAAGWTFEHHYRQMLGVFGEVVARKRAA
jgi:UDP-glucose:(heptosyl)LPS alpha-1,3-glucosyltransferase